MKLCQREATDGNVADQPPSHFHWWTSPLHRLPTYSLDQTPQQLPLLLESLPDTIDEILNNSVTDESREARQKAKQTPRIHPATALSTKAVLGRPSERAEILNHHSAKRRANKSLPQDPSVIDRLLLCLHKRPIIVVPSDNDTTEQLSVITIANALEFFEKGRLVTDHRQLKDIASRTMNSGRPVFSKKLECKSSPIKFVVADTSTTHRFEQSDWESVVSVFINGTDWQFKSWPFASNEDAFKRVKAFYCTLKDKPLPKIASRGNVQILSFPQMLRHTDGEIQRVFWDGLTEHLSQLASSLPVVTMKD